jgi:hypothetical protein
MSVVTTVGCRFQHPHVDRQPTGGRHCHCGRAIVLSQTYLLESRVERYCYRCASARCDLSAGQCPVDSGQDGTGSAGPARIEAGRMRERTMGRGYAVAFR